MWVERGTIKGTLGLSGQLRAPDALPPLDKMTLPLITVMLIVFTKLILLMCYTFAL
jgi:hypothetical protein